MDIKLKDICVGGGKYGIPASAVPYDKRKYRYLRISDISDDGFLLDDDKKSLNDEDAAQYLLTSDDIVFARTGNSTGRAFFYEQRYGDLVYAGFLIKFHLDSSKINPRFVKYYTISKLYKHWIKCYQDGSTRGNMSAQSFLNLPIPSICRKKQDSLVKILDSITEKMELNQKINLKLENIARTLYNYWFIQFDFPDEFGRPYKSSGGKMVYNATLKREIPEGWNVLNLGERLNFEKGIEPGTDNYIENPTDLVQYMKFYRVGDMDDSGTTYLLKNEYKDAPVLNPYDLVVSFDGSVGRLSFGLTGMYSSGIRRITDKLGILDASTICFIFQNPHIQAIIHKYATGSNILHAGSAISHLTIAYNENVFLKYQSIIKPLYAKLVENKKEISHLTKLRDFLLPMLMNGQVTVNS